MSTPVSSSSASSWWRRLAKVPTYYHLLCAECELRAAGGGALPPPLRQARQENLDRLREYRLRWEYPHNRHNPAGWAPCFIDEDGRRCAVAHLLDASGATEEALRIARAANYARVPEMPADVLDAWAGASGLTRAELARIQPGYVPDPAPLRPYFDAVAAAVWVVGALGFLSIVANTLRLLGTSLRRYAVAAAFGAGMTLLCLGLAPRRLLLGEYAPADAVSGSLAAYQAVAFIAGVVLLAVWAVPALGVLTNKGNTLRLLGTSLQRYATGAGFWLGIMLLCLSFGAQQRFPLAFATPGTWAGREAHAKAWESYRGNLAAYQAIAFIVGVVSLAVAVLRHWINGCEKKA